jgi:hypothetical protein
MFLPYCQRRSFATIQNHRQNWIWNMHHAYSNSKRQFVIIWISAFVCFSLSSSLSCLVSYILERMCGRNMCYVMLVLICGHALHVLQRLGSAHCNLIVYAWTARDCDLLLGFECGGPVLVSRGDKFWKMQLFLCLVKAVP